MSAFEVLALNTSIPQIQAAQSGDTYVVPRDIAFSTVASLAAGTEALPSLVATGDVNTGFWFPAADTIAASTGGTRRLTIDASGNLGLGVTPSSQYGTIKVLQIGAIGATSITGNTSAGGSSTFGQNFYSDPSTAAVKYAASAQPITLYTQYAGEHRWSFASGSGKVAGDTASPIQYMTLDASGNLGVGTTSPGQKLHVENSVNSSTWTKISNGNSGTGAAAGILFGTDQGDAGALSQNSSNAGYGTAANAVRLRNLLNAPITFETNNAERARITSGGELLVGTQNAIVWNTTNEGVAISGVAIQASRSNDISLLLNRIGSDGDIQLFARQGLTVGTISVTTTATAYNTSSDYRLKDNPQPLTNSGAFIDALKPKTWDWKADGSKGVGFIAHEAQEVSPSSVVGAKDAVDADGKPVMQAMEYGSAEFIANIIAELQSLRARVAQLEAK